MLICGDDVHGVAIVFLLQATTPIPGTLDNFHILDQNHLKQGHISNFLNLGHYIIGERNQPKYFPTISWFINCAMQMYHDLIIIKNIYIYIYTINWWGKRFWFCTKTTRLPGPSGMKLSRSSAWPNVPSEVFEVFPQLPGEGLYRV